MTNVSTTCPHEYLALRKKILLVQSQQIKNVKESLGRYLVQHYSEIWNQVRILYKNSNKSRSFSTEKLFEILDIPITSTCKFCGKVTGLLNQRGNLLVRNYCSSLCIGRCKQAQKKRAQTHYDKTGYNYIFQDPAAHAEIRKRRKARTGFANAYQNPKIRAKIVSDRIARTGYAYPMQNPEVFKRVKGSRYRKVKRFVDKNGFTHYCRGHEPYVLAWLDNHPSVRKITTENGHSLLPSIKYVKPSHKSGWYHPDIGVWMKDGSRKIIEVKDDYTLWKEEKLNKCKFKAATKVAKELDDCEFWLCVVNDKTKEMTWIN